MSNSSVQILNCVVRARTRAENATLLMMEHDEVFRGIELCGDAHAIIRNNLMDGCADDHPVENGVGMGCSAQAVVERNHLRRFRAGLYVHDDANVTARFNIIEGANGGIECRGRGERKPRVVIEANVVYQCGTWGIVVDVPARPTSGKARAQVTRNIIVGTGPDPGAQIQGALVLARVPREFVIRNNTCYNNAASADSLDHDVPSEIFWRVRRKWTRTHRNTAVGVDGRHHFYESAFLTRYGRW
jgi:Right handed beta helix region